VRLVFDAAPGDAVILGTCDLGDRFRFVANRAEVVAPTEPLPRLPVARAVWRPAPDLQTSTESWLTAGGPHHTVLSTALTAEHLVDLSDMTGTELVLIDGDTTVHRLRQELRWNQAYHRLAQGF
jgi:L-arabinose isomerase